MPLIGTLVVLCMNSAAPCARPKRKPRRTKQTMNTVMKSNPIINGEVIDTKSHTQKMAEVRQRCLKYGCQGWEFAKGLCRV